MKSSEKLYQFPTDTIVSGTHILQDSTFSSKLTDTTIVRVSTKVSQNKTQTLHNNRAAQYSRFMPRLLGLSRENQYMSTKLKLWMPIVYTSICIRSCNTTCKAFKMHGYTKNRFRLDEWSYFFMGFGNVKKTRKTECAYDMLRDFNFS